LSIFQIMKKQMSKIGLLTVIIFYLLISFQLHAQSPNSLDNPHILNVVPPSPNASALGRFGDVPVSYSTGIPDITVPLYQLKSGSMTIPVEIKYHSGGVKVTENASWIGLGWALNAGGTISRVRVGYVDEESKGFLEYKTYLSGHTMPINIASASSQAYAIFESLAYGLQDTEPDIFNFSFLGRSGQFFFDQDGNIHQKNHTDLKISVNNDFSIWTIIDEKGNKYTFSSIETTMLENTDTPIPEYTSAWNLTKIETYEKKIIHFRYGLNTPANSHSLYSVGYSQVTYIQPSNINCSIRPVDVTTRSASTYSTPYLSEIEGEGFLLKLETDPALRTDGGASLQSISLYSKNQNNLVKKYVFNHSYFEASCGALTTPIHPHTNPTLFSKLKLNGITEYSESNSVGQKYLFEYNNGALPSKCSYSQDHWGFFNGASNNNLIPYVSNFPYRSSDANREADSIAAQHGILTKITYPTGGYTEFAYESNRHKVKRKVPRPTFVTDGLYSAPGGTESITEFTVEDNNAATLSFQISDGGYPVNITPEIFILDSLNNVVTHLLNNGAMNDMALYLSAGTYKLKLIAPDAPSYIVTATIQYTAFTLEDGDRIIGGLRIKNIINKDTNGQLLVQRNFIYEKPYIPNTFINGDEYRTLKAEYQQKFEHCNYTQGNFKCEFEGRASYPIYSIGANGGYHIAYAKVTEFITGNGKTEYEYHISGSSAPTAFPQVTTLDDWSTGQLTKKVVYNQENKPLKKDIYEYDFDEKFKQVNFKVAFIFDDNCNSALNGYGRYYDVFAGNYSEYISGQAKLREHHEISYSYLTGSADSLIQNKKYFYDNPLYTFYNRLELTLSNGKTIKSLIKYPLDQIQNLSAKALTGKNALVSADRIQEILEEERYINNTFLERITTNYTNDWPNTTLSLPYNIEMQRGNQNKEIIINFSRYDTYGNILQQNQEGGIPISYLWSFGNQHPVAEVKNIEYATLESILGQTSIINFASNIPNETTVNSFLAPLRASNLLQNAHITTYTYKPLIGVSSVTDPKRMTTYYEYDGFGRLKFEKDQYGNIMKSYCYNYTGQPTNCTTSAIVYMNIAQSQTFIRNNCSPGETGGAVIYTVAAGTYSSTVSQAAADALATADITANGQTYANSNGTCTQVSTCKRYRISMPSSESNNLYIRYKPCGSSSYVTSSLMQLEQEATVENEVAVMLCTETAMYDISFMYGEYGPSQQINGLTITEIGSCQ